MKQSEARKKYNEMSTAELGKTLNDLKAELFRLRFDLATNNQKDNTELKKCRRNIARVNTILRRREILERAAK
ncbi:MAG: 50S ribosomal protein L29 [Clostridia bacterium]|nr:50S ribosomal protein L29 [Clostridia bacterium]